MCHRDITPGNILIVDDASAEGAAGVVIDLERAKVEGATDGQSFKPVRLGDKMKEPGFEKELATLELVWEANVKLGIFPPIDRLLLAASLAAYGGNLSRAVTELWQWVDYHQVLCLCTLLKFRIHLPISPRRRKNSDVRTFPSLSARM